MQMQNDTTLTLTSGHAGEEMLAENKKRIRSYPYSPGMDSDCFIHLLMTGSFHFAFACSFTIKTVNSWQFLYTQEGSLTVSCGGRTFEGKPGRLLFLSPCSSLDYRIRPGSCRFFQAGMQGQALNAYRQLLPEEISYTRENSGASCLSVCMEHLLHHNPYGTGTDTLMYSKWMNDMFTELCVYRTDSTRLHEQIPAYITEMKELFDSDYQEPWRLEQLEAQFDKSRYRLCREFTRHFGMPPISYLNHRRMEAAKELLLSTSMSVHEVGSMVGIDNTNHFINLFKKETGATPLAFKQEAPVSISELHYPSLPDVRQP